MSQKSSLNVARVLSTLDWDRLGRCLHVTLSHWKTWPCDRGELAREKQCLGKWFERNTDCGLWRLEFQERERVQRRRGLAIAGAFPRVPHWHVLAFIGDRDAGQWMDSARRWWAQTEWPNEHAEALYFSDGDGRASWYFSLHAGKRNQAPSYKVGRWWGYVHRDKLLGAQRIQPVGEVMERERVWWSRLYRRSTHCKTRNNGGFSWFLSEVGQTKARHWVGERCTHEAATRAHGLKPF